MKAFLRVNPIKCEAEGICAELFPERIQLDDWGYPIIEEGDISDELMEHAQRAVAECPRLALILQERS